MRTLLLILSIILLSGGIIYLAGRITKVFERLSFKWTLIILILFTTLTVLGSTLLFLTPSKFGSFLYNASFFSLVCMGSSILASLFVTLLNLALSLRTWARAMLTFLITIAFVAYGMVHALDVQIKDVTIPIKGLTHEVTAALITDIHLGNFYGKRQLESMVEKIIELNPDVVFNTGDLFEARVHFNDKSNVLEPFNKLSMPHYFVLGNHDEHAGVDEVLRELEKTNVIVLRNQVANLGELQIIGLDNMPADSLASKRHTLPGAETVDAVLHKLDIDKEKPTIVLHHRPEGVEYMEAKHADLLLAGHTHNGQIFPFNLIAKRTHKYNYGMYQFGDMKIYVSAGAGAVSFPIRIGTDAEITYIKLIPEINQ